MERRKEMSFFSKKITEPEPVVQEPAVTDEPELAFEEIIAEEPAIPEAKYPENLTVIGAGTIFEGNITSSDDIEINGTVRGDIASSADMKINGTGFYFGTANMANLNVDGRAEGDIDCGGHTVLTNTGYVKGSIISSRLTTAEGAVIDGVMSLNSRPRKEEKPVAPQVAVEDAAEDVPAEE